MSWKRPKPGPQDQVLSPACSLRRQKVGQRGRGRFQEVALLPAPPREGLDERAVSEARGGWQPGPGGLSPFLLLWGRKEDGEAEMSEQRGREDGRTRGRFRTKVYCHRSAMHTCSHCTK